MSDLIPKHGGYRKLKSFQIAQLVYDVTIRFCDKYIDKRSRTHDQMVQAARSGVQNIAEGSIASATSKKTELKLTQVARASLEELRLDYQDFLRHRGLPELKPDNPVLMRFKAKRCNTIEDIREWVKEEKSHMDEHKPTMTSTDEKHVFKKSVSVSDSPYVSLSDSCLVTNAALSLLNLCCYFLDRQVDRLARDFEKEGGFTERLYRVRTEKRQKDSEIGCTSKYQYVKEKLGKPRTTRKTRNKYKVKMYFRNRITEPLVLSLTFHSFSVLHTHLILIKKSNEIGIFYRYKKKEV